MMHIFSIYSISHRYSPINVVNITNLRNFMLKNSTSAYITNFPIDFISVSLEVYEDSLSLLTTRLTKEQEFIAYKFEWESIDSIPKIKSIQCMLIRISRVFYFDFFNHFFIISYIIRKDVINIKFLCLLESIFPKLLQQFRVL